MVQSTCHFTRSMGRWLMPLLLVMGTSLAARAAEAYACYTPSNTTLTFYYDNQRSSRTGTTYDLSMGDDNTPGWYTYRSSVTKVVFDSSFAGARPTSTHYWFYEMKNLTSITGLQYLNTSNVSDMSYMFYDCYKLTSLDVSHFNTSNVRMMNAMFMYCNGLTSLDVSNFNTALVTDMSRMFQGCYRLPSLDVSNFNTGNVTNMDRMFLGCRMASLDLSNFNTYYVTTMESMFLESEISSLDLSSFNTSNVKNMRHMFSECSLTSLNLSSFNTSNVTDMVFMFKDSPNLETIYVGSGWSTAAVTISARMFENCFGLVGGKGTIYDDEHMDAAYAHIDGGPSNPGYFTEWKESYACYTTANNGTLTFYFDTQRSSRTGTTYDLNTGDDVPGWYSLHEDIHHVIFDPSFADARPTSTYFWFYGFEEPEFIGWNYLNTREVTNMSGMFGFLQYLESIDVSHFDTSKVTDMSEMFEYTALTSLDLSSFNTSNVTDMRLMFSESPSLQTIYVGPGWTTAAVTSSAEMFSNCTSLVGGHGTSYSASNPKDKTYAHLDGGPSNPGYFTDPYAGAEAYACYTPSNTTLTFYYDTDRSIRTGTTYNLNTSSNSPGWVSDGTNSSVTKVVFNSTFAAARPTTTYCWFRGMQSLTSIEGIHNLNTENVTNMGLMFDYCSGLTSIDLSGFNTSKVTNMNMMFRHCSGLTSLNLSSFNTAKVTIMSNMFSYCSGLTSLNLSKFNTAQVTTVAGMFSDCTGLTSINLSSFNTANVTKMQNMFNNCPALASIDVTNFNTTNVTNMHAMFDRCRALTSIDVTNFNTANVTDMAYMFYHCPGLTSLDLISFNTANVTTMLQMFEGCTGLMSLDLSNFNTAKVNSMSNMFYNCSNLTTIYVGSGWTTDPVTSSSQMFYNCTNLVGGMGTTYEDYYPMDKTFAHIDGGPDNPGYFTAAGTEAYACYTPSDSTLTFYYDSQRSTRTGTTYDLNVTIYAPYWYSDHTRSKVTKVVFDPSFAAARPTTTCNWFSEMKKLESITGMEYLNTSEVTVMNFMFSECMRLKSLDLSHFNTSRVTNMQYMFYGCDSLASIDLSSFETLNVNRMAGMFYNCRSLMSLDLSGFNTSEVTDMQSMFQDCSNLRTIYVGSGWTTNSVTSSSDMFTNCTSLVGGQGTTYDASHVGKAYAHIDGGPSNPGYFTAEGAEPWHEPEAYACYTPSNTTLTFYYDNQRSTREGTTYDLNVGMANPGWDDDNSYTSVTHVVFDPSFADARPVSTCSWFWGMTNLQSITGMDCMNTEDVTTMWGMFTTCSSLTTIDLSSFNTSKVTNMLGMFSGCSNLTTIYAGSGWSTATVSVGVNMFTNCTKLVGGQGTTYNANHVDKSYAHIDGGTSNPGYFTDKNASLRGDVNGDGQVKISDVTALINYLLSGEASGINLQAADCNLDGQVKIGDVTALINYLLSGTW